MDKNIITFVNAGINILSDLVLAIVPIPLLWKLQIPKRQKLILTSLFGLGTFASLMSVVRLFSLKQIAESPDEEQSGMLFFSSASSVLFSPSPPAASSFVIFSHPLFPIHSLLPLPPFLSLFT